MFNSVVIPSLLYESEKPFSEKLNANRLQNSPAIFILRFLYYFPHLMVNESPHSGAGKGMCDMIKELTSYCQKNCTIYFPLPSPK